MLVRYIGHSCFLLRSSKGSNVLVDPFGSHVPYDMPDLEPDIVVVSHEHRDHNAAHRFSNSPMVAKRTHDFMCESELKVARTDETFTFTGIPTHHDAFSGRKRGPNTVWHWYMDGIHFCHLGDLGHILKDDQVKFIGKVDVVFLPVGGKETIDPTQAALVSQQLKAKVIFPMHFLTPEIEALGLCEYKLEDFTSKMSLVEDLSSTAMDIELARLPTKTTVKVLKANG